MVCNGKLLIILAIGSIISSIGARFILIQLEGNCFICNLSNMRKDIDYLMAIFVGE